MASILDAGLVSIFTGIFVFLLVLAIAFGSLMRLKPFGDKQQNQYAMIAFAVALLAAFAPPVRNFVTFVAPWYLALAIVLFFVIFIIGLFGISAEKDLPKIINDSKMKNMIAILSVLIFVAGLAFTFGQQTLEVTQGPAPVPVDGNGQMPIDGQYYPPGTIVPSGGTLGPEAGMPGSTATPSFQQNFINTLIHPKVLGLMVTFLIAAVAIYFLSS
jgi:hypothetical protein